MVDASPILSQKIRIEICVFFVFLSPIRYLKDLLTARSICLDSRLEPKTSSVRMEAVCPLRKATTITLGIKTHMTDTERQTMLLAMSVSAVYEGRVVGRMYLAISCGNVRALNNPPGLKSLDIGQALCVCVQLPCAQAPFNNHRNSFWYPLDTRLNGDLDAISRREKYRSHLLRFFLVLSSWISNRDSAVHDTQSYRIWPFKAHAQSLNFVFMGFVRF